MEHIYREAKTLSSTLYYKVLVVPLKSIPLAAKTALCLRGTQGFLARGSQGFDRIARGEEFHGHVVAVL
jgi:hypothetical protein